MLIRSLSLLGRLSTYIGSFLLGMFFVWFVIASLFSTPADVNSTQPVLFMANKGDAFQAVAKRLEEQKIVKHWWVLYILSRLLKEDEQAKLSKFAYGEYSLSAAMKPKEILRKFINSDVVRYTFTIPEGSNLRDIVEKISKTGLAAKEELEDLLVEPTREANTLILELGLNTKTLEGYLFPDTYGFTKPITAQEIIKHLFQTTSKNITAEMRNRASELTFSFHEILVLASIIEKETAAADERPIISSVFHNRLRIGLPLQSDPTVIYGLITQSDSFDGNLTRAHLQKKTPYNTYLNTGLPPSPICSPGIASINAALHPANEEYMYFVAKNDGSGNHFFSKTYAEHQKAVELFQKGNASAAESLIKAIDQQSNAAKIPNIVDSPETRNVSEDASTNKRGNTSSGRRDVDKPDGAQEQNQEIRKPQKSISQLDPIRRRPIILDEDSVGSAINRGRGGDN